MTIYMKATGLTGDVQATEYKNWIALNNFSYPGITNTLENVVGKSADRITRRPDFSEVTITKNTDSSSTYLFEYAFSGQILDLVDIHFVSTGNPPETYEMWQLQNVLISHFGLEHHTHGYTSIEHISLNYTSIQRTYKGHTGTTHFAKPIISGYDLKTAQKL